ncbi:protein takeout-like [Musca vetustissima]|uniref:protein takeout-like n=1 Tax=Musca vetustissima TaxID=27455 RepID=UPI002AB75ADA|nr:protein takeout-like [Musca vetustissima]
MGKALASYLANPCVNFVNHFIVFMPVKKMIDVLKRALGDGPAIYRRLVTMYPLNLYSGYGPCLFSVAIFLFVTRSPNIHTSDFPKCKNGDSACLVKTANEVVHKYHTGNRDVNLIPFDPLRVKVFELEKNPSSPVNVGFKFNDIEVYGLKNMHVTAFDGLRADMKGRNNFEATVPEVIIKGHYQLEGRVLLLPVVGNGQSEIKIKNVKIKYAFDFKPVVKNGKTYGTLEHVKMELYPGETHFHFDNLFNGDKALGDNMNGFINTNSKEITNELIPSFTKSLSLLVKQMINAFYEKHPYCDHFLEPCDI